MTIKLPPPESDWYEGMTEKHYDLAVSRAVRAAIEAYKAELAKQEPSHYLALLDEDQRPHQLQTRLHRVGFRTWQDADNFVASERDMNGWRYTIEPLYTHPAPAQQAHRDPLHDDIQSVLFEVEQAVKNGCCPWQIEAAFEAYEAAQRLQQPAHGIRGEK